MSPNLDNYFGFHSRFVRFDSRYDLHLDLDLDLLNEVNLSRFLDLDLDLSEVNVGL